VDDDEGAGTRPPKRPESPVGRNANIETVLNEQREKRDQAKSEHAKKKDKDKDDR